MRCRVLQSSAAAAALLAAAAKQANAGDANATAQVAHFAAMSAALTAAMSAAGLTKGGFVKGQWTRSLLLQQRPISRSLLTLVRTGRQTS